MLSMHNVCMNCFDKILLHWLQRTFDLDFISITHLTLVGQFLYLPLLSTDFYKPLMVFYTFFNYNSFAFIVKIYLFLLLSFRVNQPMIIIAKLCGIHSGLWDRHSGLWDRHSGLWGINILKTNHKSKAVHLRL